MLWRPSSAPLVERAHAGTPGAPVDLPGGFGGLLEFGDHLLAMATDGVGSKLQIASSLNAWSGVGIDCMAMNVNDLLCVGAEPMAFVDYIAVPKPDPEVHAAIGASLAEACRRARVTLAGGETASLPGIVTEVDLSGTALGYMGRDQAITGEHLQAGDVLIGLPASGIHSNGYSLVRRIMEHVGADLSAAAPFDAVVEGRRIERFATQDGEAPTLGEVLLNPTQIYVDPVIDLLKHLDDGHLGGRSSVRGLCHVTGGGLSNLLRLHPTLGWRIDAPYPYCPNLLGCRTPVGSKPARCTGPSTWAWAWCSPWMRLTPKASSHGWRSACPAARGRRRRRRGDAERGPRADRVDLQPLLSITRLPLLH